MGCKGGLQYSSQSKRDYSDVPARIVDSAATGCRRHRKTHSADVKDIA